MRGSSDEHAAWELRLRWAARVWSLASVLTVIAFIVGERSHPSTLAEWTGFAFFPLGICAGMILAWWREGLGGLVTVASFGVFYGLCFLTAGAFPRGWAWLVFAAPGFLFVVTWFLARRRLLVES